MCNDSSTDYARSRAEGGLDYALVCAQRFGDACGLGQTRDGDEKGLRGEKLDLDAIEEDVRDIRKQLELCSVAAKEDGLESGEQPNGPKCAFPLCF